MVERFTEHKRVEGSTPSLVTVYLLFTSNSMNRPVDEYAFPPDITYCPSHIRKDNRHRLCLYVAELDGYICKNESSFELYVGFNDTPRYLVEDKVSWAGYPTKRQRKELNLDARYEKALNLASNYNNFHIIYYWYDHE